VFVQLRDCSVLSTFDHGILSIHIVGALQAEQAFDYVNRVLYSSIVHFSIL
jgi:hypothetical protein